MPASCCGTGDVEEDLRPGEQGGWYGFVEDVYGMLGNCIPVADLAV